jgi:5,10-methylene-tetrahydrofolate dehydrogenase/methenyl tetrahydrofolate cyclohydrolase
MKLLDGKLVSQAVKDDLKTKTSQLREKGGKIPHLAAILVGNNGASETYVASKVKSCEEIGFRSTLTRLEEQISEEELLQMLTASWCNCPFPNTSANKKSLTPLPQKKMWTDSTRYR